MPPEKYEGDIRHGLYEILVEDEEQLEWFLESDEGGAKLGLAGLDGLVEEEGRKVRQELEEQGCVVRQVSDLSLGWMTVLHDFVGEEEIRSIVDVVEDESEQSHSD